MKLNMNYFRQLRKELISFLRILYAGIRKNKKQYNDFDLGGNVSLYYWKLYEDLWDQGVDTAGKEVQNLGDYLSVVVASHYRNLIAPEYKRPSASCPKRTLYAIGSILGFRCQDAVVWGSGLLGPRKKLINRLKFSKLDIRSVRGPKTREILLQCGKKCPELYGDPAILMPEIYQPEDIQKNHNISLVLHYANKGTISVPESINIIDIVTSDYQGFIDQIVQSTRVISSSLHGVILAESYGVPAVLMLKEGVDQFKYLDWYYSTGRYDIVIAHNLQEAIDADPMPLPDLQEMRAKLRNAFPTDLWK